MGSFKSIVLLLKLEMIMSAFNNIPDGQTTTVLKPREQSSITVLKPQEQSC